MGPYEFKQNKEHGGIPALTPNPLSWNNQSNLLIVDAQIGTGYSYVRGATNKKKIDYTEATAVKYWIRFMKQFFTHFDEFRGREIYIVGQDYFGAKLIP
jgi:carboxypeptidase C (cathepsin A)